MNAPDREAVERDVRELLGADGVGRLERLTGGASRQTWLIEVDGRTVIAQRQQPEADRDMRIEASVLRAAESAGVPAPRVLACGATADGGVTLVTSYVPGETIARRVLRNDDFATAREVLVEQIGRAMARVHRIDPAAVSALEPVDGLALYREQLDECAEPHPTFELAMRWLDDHRSNGDEPACVVHGDFRLGNLIVDHSGLAAVIDWELAHLGNPLHDLGWACVPSWRFGSPLPAAGLGSRAALLDAYNSEAGTAYSIDELRWWEVFGILRWGVMCMTQAQRHLSRTTRSHELAAIGRRVCETEHDLFLALEGRW